MSNPQGSGKQGRKAAKSKASRPPQEAAAGTPGRSEHYQAGQSARPDDEQGRTSHRPASSHSTQTVEDE